jgi:hypothetical protein
VVFQLVELKFTLASFGEGEALMQAERMVGASALAVLLRSAPES